MNAALAEPVVAVVVTYHPNLELLELLLRSVLPQVTSVVIVDNGSGSPTAGYLAKWAGENVKEIILDTNIGVAEALNVGIRHAGEAGAKHVLLFDQDSQPAPDMVARLLAAWSKLENDGIKVGALGPVQVDRRTAEEIPFVLASMPDAPWGIRGLPAGESLLEVDHLITSGCLISMDIIERVGLMMPELFIDGVDLEWGWRCQEKGYRLYGVGGARLLHSIGDERIRIGWLRINRHSPLRQYYITRNLVYLRTRSYTPRNWSRRCKRTIFLRFVMFSFILGPRWRNCRHMLRGLRDGLQGRLGKLSS